MGLFLVLQLFYQNFYLAISFTIHPADLISIEPEKKVRIKKIIFKSELKS